MPSHSPYQNSLPMAGCGDTRVLRPTGTGPAASTATALCRIQRHPRGREMAAGWVGIFLAGQVAGSVYSLVWEEPTPAVRIAAGMSQCCPGASSSHQATWCPGTAPRQVSHSPQEGEPLSHSCLLSSSFQEPSPSCCILLIFPYFM